MRSYAPIARSSSSSRSCASAARLSSIAIRAATFSASSDALLEQLDALAPRPCCDEQPLERLEHARLAGIDRLRAAPRLDRAIGPQELLDLDAAELEQQLQLLVLVGVAGLHAVANQLANVGDELLPRLVLAMHRELLAAGGDVRDRDLDLDLVARLDAPGAARRPGPTLSSWQPGHGPRARAQVPGSSLRAAGTAP